MLCPDWINAKKRALSCGGTCLLVPKGTPYFFLGSFLGVGFLGADFKEPLGFGNIDMSDLETGFFLGADDLSIGLTFELDFELNTDPIIFPAV